MPERASHTERVIWLHGWPSLIQQKPIVVEEEDEEEGELLEELPITPHKVLQVV